MSSVNSEVRRNSLAFSLALVLVTVTTGLASWLFLLGLELVTDARLAHPGCFLLAPLVGLMTGFLYHSVSPQSSAGNGLLVALMRAAKTRDLSEVQPLRRVPQPMAFVILVTTWLAHLAGLSVGREGTAVQMGGGLASSIGRLVQLKSFEFQKLILGAGIAAGFGSVFGVPLAGAVFALEVSGGFRHRKVPVDSCARLALQVFTFAFASYGADFVARAAGARHFQYPQFALRDLSGAAVWGGIVVIAIGSGLIAWMFLLSLHRLRILLARVMKRSWLTPFVGGILVLPMAWSPESFKDYAGLGTRFIAGTFVSAAPLFAFFFKAIATVFSLAFGFRGGEVTPLFFIGASFASWLSGFAGLAPQPYASLGLVAVFAAAAGVPLTCSVMAAELFGASALPAALPVCLVAHWVCRHSRLYDAEL